MDRDGGLCEGVQPNSESMICPSFRAEEAESRINQVLHEQRTTIHAERVKEREAQLARFVDFERKLEMALVRFKVRGYK